MMRGKPYIKPKMYVVEVETTSIVATSTIIDTDSKGDFDEDFVGGHRGRGSWGNLWEKKK